MDKPDVDFIEGLSPAISIDQKTASRNPRSTVGTITEIHDYLRLLFARVGVQHCPNCGKVVTRQTPQQIVDQVLAQARGRRGFLVLPPWSRVARASTARSSTSSRPRASARARRRRRHRTEPSASHSTSRATRSTHRRGARPADVRRRVVSASPSRSRRR